MTITEFAQTETANAIQMQFAGMVAGSIYFKGNFDINGRSLVALCSFSMDENTFDRIELFEAPTLRELARAKFDVNIIERDGKKALKQI